LHIELFAPRDHARRFIEGIAANATGTAIEIRPLKLYRSSHGLDRAADEFASPHQSTTLRTRDLLALMFTTVDMSDHRLGDAPGELLA
jgi:hypothetical protein